MRQQAHDVSKKTLKIFYCYSHKDQNYRDQLERHLSNLKRLYNLQTWFDRNIKPGENWEAVLEENLKTSDLIFLLVSPEFMYSDYCYNKEMAYALERHSRGEAKVIPIIIRHVHWANAPFSHIQLLPTNARPIRSWSDPDRAFYDVVIEIEKMIQDLLLSSKRNEWSETGTVLYNLKNYKEALQAFEQAILLDPKLALDTNFALVYNKKGSTLEEPESHSIILQAFEDAIRLNPNSFTAYRGKGDALFYLNRYEEALQAFEQAIQLDPTSRNIYRDKSNTLNSLNKYKEALQAFKQAIQLDPTDTSIHNGKVYALNKHKIP